MRRHASSCRQRGIRRRFRLCGPLPFRKAGQRRSRFVPLGCSDSLLQRLIRTSCRCVGASVPFVPANGPHLVPLCLGLQPFVSVNNPHLVAHFGVSGPSFGEQSRFLPHFGAGRVRLPVDSAVFGGLKTASRELQRSRLVTDDEEPGCEMLCAFYFFHNFDISSNVLPLVSGTQRHTKMAEASDTSA